MKSPNRKKHTEIQNAKLLRYRQRKEELHGQDSRFRDPRKANVFDEETLQRAQKFLREWFVLRGSDFIFWHDCDYWWSGDDPQAIEMLNEAGLPYDSDFWENLVLDGSVEHARGNDIDPVGRMGFIISQLLRTSSIVDDRFTPTKSGLPIRKTDELNSVDASTTSTPNKDLFAAWSLICRMAANRLQINQAHELQRLVFEIPSKDEQDIVSSIATRLGLNATNVLFFRKFWVRSPMTFKSDGDINSFLKHIFCRYDVPACLEKVWRQGFTLMERQTRWDQAEVRDTPWNATSWFTQASLYVHIAQGGSMRELGKSMGRRIHENLQAHLFQVPRELNFEASIVYAEVLRLGGHRIDAERLMRDPSYVVDPTLCRDEEFLRFWRDSIRWLARHREQLTNEQADAILGWAQHRFTEGENRRGAEFRWKGRSLQSTLRIATAYFHRLESIVHPYEFLQWNRHDWDWTHWDFDGQSWTFRELNSSKALQEEGKAMSHCVGGYSFQCKENRSAIFSLLLNNERSLTIEIDPSSGRIFQCRGYRNRLPSRKEEQIVELWIDTIVKNKTESPSE